MRATLATVSGTGRERQADLATFLTPALRDTVRVEANAWIKRLRLVPFDGQDMRQRFTYRDDSLWWFTELYLHKMRKLDQAISVALALDAACEQHAPARLVIEADDPGVLEAAAAFGRARSIPIDVGGATPASLSRGPSSYLIGLTAQLSRLRPARAASIGRARVAAFVHTAFWRASREEDGPARETYIGPILAALARRVAREDLRYVGVGPRHNFRTRRWWDPVTALDSGRPFITPIERLSRRGDLNGSFALWTARHDLARLLTTGDAIHDAAKFRGIDLWPVLRRELEGVALLQWPWSARAMDEAAAAISVLAPDVVLTYAEAGGWGRAIVLEARRRGVRSVGLQHGFIYRHWLNYQHEPDELEPRGSDAGFPAPDRTLLFDDYAAATLRGAGHFPVGRVAVTGNPGLDALVQRFGRRSTSERLQHRRAFGVDANERVAVLAAKFSEARPFLSGLASAVRARPMVRLIIKTHPAETADVYAEPFAQLRNVTVAPASTELASVLMAADGIVTVNSTVAVDALVLGIPSLVIGLPNNLTPFVEAGVMLGASTNEAIGSQLETLLYDEEARRRLADAAERFTTAHGMASDGRAAERAAEAVLNGRS